MDERSHPPRYRPLRDGGGIDTLGVRHRILQLRRTRTRLNNV